MATKLKGTCVVCGKKLTVNRKGFLGEHSNSTDGENSHGYCLGSYDVPPRESAVEGFHQVREDAINSANRIQRTLDSDPDYRPQTLKAMAAEVEGFYVTAERMQEEAKLWQPGQLEEVAASAKRKEFGSGTCVVCNRVFKLKKDGTLRAHNSEPNTPVSHQECYGTDFLPLETSREDCHKAIDRLECQLDYFGKRLSGEDGREPLDKEKRADYRLRLKYYEQSVKNVQRNYDLWSQDKPVPSNPLTPVTEKEVKQKSRTGSNSRPEENSGCLGAVLMMAVPTILITWLL